MSLNLGNDGIAALRDMANDPNFQTLKQALWDRASSLMNTAIEAPREQRDDLCGYARALRDLFIAFESGASGQNQREIKRPGPVR